MPFNLSFPAIFAAAVVLPAPCRPHIMITVVALPGWEVKMALLEADVNFKVVKQFVKSVEERAVGSDVMNGLNPGQMVINAIISSSMCRRPAVSMITILLLFFAACSIDAFTISTGFKLQNVFKNLRSKGRLTEADVKAALKEVKMALLEADVNFKVVRKILKDRIFIDFFLMLRQQFTIKIIEHSFIFKFLKSVHRIKRLSNEIIEEL